LGDNIRIKGWGRGGLKAFLLEEKQTNRRTLCFFLLENFKIMALPFV
jgi:hypothetical protein